ncbi:MAG: YesL family protein [Lachnospiraceae bacterium]|nr:YesL family protein [Lachnospiraceae bacterium]
MKLFNTDSVLFRIMELLRELALMNVLFLLCCIPIVTIGASYKALLACCFDLEYGEGRFSAAFFIRKFKENAGKSIRIWIPGCLVILLLGYNLSFCMGISGKAVRFAGVGVYAVLMIWCCGVLQYYFAFLARESEGNGKELKNSMILALAKYPAVVLMTVCSASAGVILLLPAAWVLRLLPLILFFWFSSPALVCARLIGKTAAPYYPELFRSRGQNSSK